MASTRKGSSRPAHPPGVRRNRPSPPTIDLKATEVAPPPPEASVSPPEPDIPPVAEATESVPPPESMAAAGAPEAVRVGREQANRNDGEHTDATAPRVESEPPPAAPPPPRAAAWAAVAPHLTWPPSRPVIAGGAVVALVLVVAGLWGLFSSRDDAADALSLRMALIESQLRQLADRPAAAAPDPRPMADLTARVTAAEQAAARAGDLAARVAASEQALRRVEGSAATGVSRVQTIEERVAKIETAPRPAAADPALGGRIEAADAALKALTERLAAVEAALKPLAERPSAAPAADQALARATAVEDSIKTLSERVGELGQRVEQAAQVARSASREAASAASGADRAVRLAVTATALRDAVARGEPFAAELAAVKPLVADPARLVPLEAYAAGGVPSAAALARELAALVPAIVAVAAPARSDGGVLDRLQASAERFVRIRPVNETPGDDPAAVIARIEGRAAAQAIDAARAELAKLPADMRAPAQGWSAAVEKRAAALAAVQSLARDAVAALAKE